MQTKNVDVLILGGGIVGLTFAALLSKTDLKIGLFEPQKPHFPKKFSKSAPFDLRVFAINRASENIFRQIGIWEKFLEKRVSPYRYMYVFEETNKAFLNFESEEIFQLNLGNIIENTVIVSSLYEFLEAQDNVQFFWGDKPLGLWIDPESSEVKLESENFTIKSKLIVGADGANSWLRQQCRIPIEVQNYHQHALVATVKTDLSHQETAWQRFLKESILAFLPLNHPHYSSIVWSVDSKRAHTLQKMEPQKFNLLLTQAFAAQLGNVELVSERIIFPLCKQHAKTYVQNRVALIGDAIHTLHPLAGQGLNLGLQDTKMLYQVICEAKDRNADFGLFSYLRRYERDRKFNNAMTIHAMDALRCFFKNQSFPFNFVHEIGLGIFQNSGFLKENLMKKALGL